MTTLADILRLALPTETQLLYGHHLLHAPVTWAAALRPSPPAFPHLTGGELILIDPADLVLLDASLLLSSVLSDLSSIRVAGVAVLGLPMDDAIRTAEQLEIPLLALPTSVRLSDVEREVVRAIVNRQAHIERFASQLTNELTNLVIRGASLDQIGQVVARHANAHILIHDMLGELLVSASPAGRVLDEQLLPDLRTDTLQLFQQHADNDPFLAPLPGGRGQRWAVFIVNGQQRLAILSAFDFSDQLDDVTRLAAERSALTFAMELGRRQAISESEISRRRQFIQDLIAAPDPTAITFTQRALQWGYELERRQVAFYVGSDQPVTMPVLHRMTQLIEAELKQRRVPIFVVPEEETGNILVLAGLGAGKPARRGRRLATALYERLTVQLSSVPLRIGVGRSGDGVPGLLQSIDEAAQALQLSKRIRSAGPVSYYGDLGLFRLLLPLQGGDVLRKFYDETLGALAAYDARQQTNLVETLAAYFTHRGNLSRTAEALYLHRNTLLYRMERIAAIIGHDLNDPELRLMLQVAFKVQHLL